MNEMELRHLRAVCAIAEAGSVTKAAMLLGVTQPALSAQLRTMERLVDGKLFERGNDGSTPTDLGAYVVGTAVEVLDELDDLVSRARRRARAA